MLKISADLPSGAMVTRVSELVISIGRSCENVVVLDDPTVSASHARITWNGSAYRIEDLGSANGVWVEGAEISEGWFTVAMTCYLGAVCCTVEVCDPCFLCNESPFLIATPVVTVGRAASNNWVLPYPAVSSYHLSLILDGGQMFVHNFSAQGTLVSGLLIDEAPLAPGDEIQLGEISIFYTSPPLLDEGFRFDLSDINGGASGKQFRVVGALDRDQAVAFDERLKILSIDDVKTLDLDMSACSKLHPMCLDVLLNAAKKFTASNKRLRLISPSRAVSRAVALANARQYLTLVD